MACRPRDSGSYAVVIIPLRTSLYSLDALRFYLWIKHLKDLEKEKDTLWCGLEILEKTRLWYLHRLQENRARQDIIIEAKREVSCSRETVLEAQSCLLRSLIQRVNGCLGSVMSEASVTSSSITAQAVGGSALRWRNTVLTHQVSDKNHQITMLEEENDALLEQLDELQQHS